MKPVLGINLLPYYPGGQGGAEVYIRNLVQALIEFTDVVNVVLFVNQKGAKVYHPGVEGFSEIVVPGADGGRLRRIFAEQVSLPLHVRRAHVDWLFSNYVVPVLAPCKQVVNVHDMLYKVHPEWVGEQSKVWYWRAMIPASLWRVSKVFTVSESSAADIRRFFPSTRAKTHVTVEGVSRDLLDDVGEVSETQFLKRLGITKPYVLSAATFGPNKNIARLIEAFKRVRQAGVDAQLVLTGRKERGGKALDDLLTKLQLHKHVVFTNFVSASELAALYRNAHVHVMPSMFEGFGLSVIEAQHFGCPVACSNVTSLPEVAGPGAALFDPLDVDDMANVVTRLLKDADERAALRQAGFANVQRYTWRQAALDLVAVAVGETR